MFQPVVKWTGSKRNLSSEILSYFPRKIKTYYEPFIGGGSVLRALLDSDIRVKHYVASDICQPLISLWCEIRDHPVKLAKSYRDYWRRIQENNDAYYDIRDEFNADQSNVGAFLCLTRTCVNGMIRFNSQGNFNASFHLNRSGIKPRSLKEIILDWSHKIQPVEFILQSYNKIKPTAKDFCFFDPPYAGTKALYYGNFDVERFFRFLRKSACPYALTFDGERDGQLLYEIPTELYDEHIYLSSAISSFSRYKKDISRVRESLYLKGIRCGALHQNCTTIAGVSAYAFHKKRGLFSGNKQKAT